jgi:uncharacterized protein YlxW (UPF0749 family)
MLAATLEERVTGLERRMSDLEGQVGFLIPLVRQIHLDLLGFKEDVDRRFKTTDAKIDRLDAKVDRLDAKVDRLDAKVDQLNAKVNQLDAKVDAMPRAVAEIVAEIIKK